MVSSVKTHGDLGMHVTWNEAANAATDAAADATGARLISTGASRVKVYVIPTDEERMIAHHTLEILKRQRRC